MRLFYLQTYQTHFQTYFSCIRYILHLPQDILNITTHLTTQYHYLSMARPQCYSTPTTINKIRHYRMCMMLLWKRHAENFLLAFLLAFSPNPKLCACSKCVEFFVQTCGLLFRELYNNYPNTTKFEYMQHHLYNIFLIIDIEKLNRQTYINLMLIVISYTSYHHATHSYISTCYTSN